LLLLGLPGLFSRLAVSVRDYFRVVCAPTAHFLQSLAGLDGRGVVDLDRFDNGLCARDCLTCAGLGFKEPAQRGDG
jgi:hypothetical protein